MSAAGQGSISVAQKSSGAGYTVHLLSNNAAVTTNATRFLGYFPNAPVTTATPLQILIARDGIIKLALVEMQSATAGSAENWSVFLRLNDTTDHLIQTLGVSTLRRSFLNASMNIKVNAGDFIVIKSITPAFAVVPGVTQVSGYIIIE